FAVAEWSTTRAWTVLSARVRSRNTRTFRSRAWCWTPATASGSARSTWSCTATVAMAWVSIATTRCAISSVRSSPACPSARRGPSRFARATVARQWNSCWRPATCTSWAGAARPTGSTVSPKCPNVGPRSPACGAGRGSRAARSRRRAGAPEAHAAAAARSRWELARGPSLSNYRKPVPRISPRLAYAASVSIVSVGCAAPEERTDFRIVNGAEDPGDPAVAYLGVFEDPTGSIRSECSGTLIRDRWILTAAHCLDSDTLGFEPGAIVAYFGSTVLEEDDTQLFATNAVTYTIHGQWNHEAPELGFDAALVQLREPVPIAPIPIRPTPLASSDLGKPLRLVGWGITEEGGY